MPRAARTFVRRAPGTYIWLGVLLVMSVVTRRLPAGDLEVLLGNRSTDLHHLAEDPVPGAGVERLLARRRRMVHVLRRIHRLPRARGTLARDVPVAVRGGDRACRCDLSQ
ncbi:rhomboid-like protein [Rhodococcus gordoniae]|uniref:rhomboid-like protein n=1 Tax=Rhodococcus gordoniae TaxID=223392 RepID=UPI003CC911FB